MRIHDVFSTRVHEPVPPAIQTYETLTGDIADAHGRGHLYGVMSALTHFFYAPDQDVRVTSAGNRGLYDLLNELGYEARPVNDDFDHDYPKERDLYLIGLALNDLKQGNGPGRAALSRMAMTVQGVHPSHWAERLAAQDYASCPVPAVN